MGGIISTEPDLLAGLEPVATPEPLPLGPLFDRLDFDSGKSSGQDKSIFDLAKDTLLEGLEAIAEPQVRESEGARKAVDLNFISGPDSVDFIEAAASGIPATIDAWNDAKSGWSKFFMTLSVAEQQVARQLVNGLENINLVSTPEAKDLLSRTILHPSDVLKFYWKEEDDETSIFTLRNFVGFGVDVFLDPLTYIAAPLVIGTKAGRKFMALANGSLADSAKLSQWQRKSTQAVDDINNIITSDNRFKTVRANLKNQNKNLELLGRLTDDKITFGQLEQRLKLTPESQNLINTTTKDLFSTKGLFREFAEGERLITFGQRIPFTDLGFEFRVQPATWIAEHGSKTMLNIANSDVLGGAAQFLNRVPVVREGIQFGGEALQAIWTKTGNSDFDEKLISMSGGKRQFGSEMAKFNQQAEELVGQIEDVSTQAAVKRDIIDELEFGYSETPIDFLAKFGIAPTAQQLAQVKRTPADLARLSRLNQRPEIIDTIKNMRTQNDQMLQEYKLRGIPIAEINPLGKNQVRGYVKHLVTEDYLKIKAAGKEASDEMIEQIQRVTGKRVDLSATYQRRYAGGITEINQKFLEEKGVKLFVDEPFELHSRRMTEMDNIVRNWDVMDSAARSAVKTPADQHPGFGWAEVDVDMLRKRFSTFAKSFDEGGQSEAALAKFFPDFYNVNQKKEKVWLPYSIHDRMTTQLINTFDRQPTNAIIKALEVGNKIFYNNALFGAGYHGLNNTSNFITLLTGGVENPAKRMAQAWNVVLNPAGNKAIKIKNPDTGVESLMDSSELWDELVKREIIGTGILNMNWIDNADAMSGAHHLQNQGAFPMMKMFAKGVQGAKDSAVGIATDTLNKNLTKETGKNFGSLVDYALLWRMNRFAGQFGDDLAKVGMVIDRLENGYSMSAAAEAAERYFYNYNNISSRLRKANKVVPFITFPVKTLELTIKELSEGRFKTFTIPEKVKRVIEGGYVPDLETRKNMEQVFPDYIREMDSIHGPLLPGMKMITFELPWAKSTLSMFLNGNVQIHPFLKAAGAMVGQFVDDFNEPKTVEGAVSQTPFEVSQALDTMMPPTLSNIFAISEINGLDGGVLGGFFSKKFISTPPVGAEFDKENLPKTIKFDNDIEFGKFIEKSMGDDFLFNMLFPERINLGQELTPTQETTLIKRGNFIRSKFRQFTFGAARMTSLDRNFLMNTGAINRQIRKQVSFIKKQLATEFGPNRDLDISTPEARERIKDIIPNVEVLTELELKRDDLIEYYDLVLKSEREFPDSNIFEIMYGTTDYKFDFEGFGKINREYEQIRSERAKDALIDLTPQTRLEEIIEP